MLSEEGWVTVHCTHGLEAVRQARAGEYEVILLDWMLPDIDGLAACRELRRASSPAGTGEAAAPLTAHFQSTRAKVIIPES
ncbi:response regulator [Nannocystis pusilla]|uniref:response regulator n=1 Tax=Nannocystis pusilla TaxID=889268 RepID=UPI003BF4305D